MISPFLNKSLPDDDAGPEETVVPGCEGAGGAVTTGGAGGAVTTGTGASDEGAGASV